MNETITFEISEELYEEIMARIDALGISLEDFLVQAMQKKLNQ